MSDANTVWDDDVLDRRYAANFLNHYLISRYTAKPAEPGFVLAVDAEWGYGKSFMIERWHRVHRFENHPSIHFDAWQSDFSGAPLLAFIAELEEGLAYYLKHMGLAPRARMKTRRLLKDLWKPALTILASVGARHLVGMSLASLQGMLETEAPPEDEAKEGAEGEGRLEKFGADVLDELAKALEAHRTIKTALAVFKARLAALIQYFADEGNMKLPLFIFVDELDRCRPSYAIELLEGIKHLFGVPGVYFVIATNLGQLSESVKAVYGGGFDGRRYLHRFFDLRYTLGEPSNERFARLLTGAMTIPPNIGFVHGLWPPRIPMGENGQPDRMAALGYVLARHADAFNLTLRDQKQIAILVEASLHALYGAPVHLFFLVFLAAVYHQDAAEFRHMADTHTFGEHSGAVQTARKAKRGQLDLRGGDDRGQPVDRGIGMFDIAARYLAYLRGEDPDATPAQSFVADLLAETTTVSEDRMRASIGHYFDVVQQAGGFGD